MKFLFATPLLLTAVSALVIPDVFKGENFFRPEAVAPLLTSSTAMENIIPDQYIIVFKNHVDEYAATKHHSWVSAAHESCISGLMKRGIESPFLASGLEHGLRHIFSLAGKFSGYSGRFEASVIELIRRHPDVSYLSYDD